MTKSDNSSLEKFRNAAQYFTMSAAALSGVVWLLGLAVDNSDTLNTLASVFIGATCIGGVVMDTLYLLHLSKKKQRSLRV